MVEAHRLSDDIYRNILSRLPAKSLLQYKTVCKQWKAMISDPHFISQHALHSSNPCFEFFASVYPKSSRPFLWNTSAAGIPSSLQDFLLQTSADIVGSCNGILCSWKYDGLLSSITILNPANMDFFTLPDPLKETLLMCQEPFANYSVETSIGLAFDPSIGLTSFRYRVVLVEALVPTWQASYESPHDLKFQIFDSKIGAWSMSKEANSCYTISDGSPVFHKGVLFWLCIKVHILAFDVQAEKSWLIEFPADTLEEERTSGPSPGWEEEWFGASERNLCFVRTSITRMNVWASCGDHKQAKWVLKYSVCIQTVVDNHLNLLNAIVNRQSYSNEMACLKRSWNLKVCEMDVKLFHPLCLCGDDTVLLRAGDSILSYNAKTKSLDVCYNFQYLNFVYVYPYSSNLVTFNLFKRDGG